MSQKTRTMTGLALFTAIVVVLQLLGSFIHIGPVSISLVLIPLVVGAAVYGPKAGAYLGGVFGLVAVIASATALDPGGAMFWNAQPLFTVVTIMVKGILAGLVSGVVYRVIARKNSIAAAIVAAILCPIVNTGIFCLALFTLFYGFIVEMAGGSNLLVFVLTSMVGINFLLEFIVNLVVSPIIVRIIDARRSLSARRV